MRVGIAMAVYEPYQRFLLRQLDSIRAQEGVSWLAHVVDDGSGHASFESTRALLEGDERFVLHRTDTNRGSVAAFGDALRHVAREDVDAVALADQDDVWHADRLAATARELGPTVAAAHSDLRLIDAQGGVLADSVWAHEHRWTTTDLRRTVFRNSVTGCALTVRPDVLRLALPLPERPRPAPYHHDAWLTMHALRLGEVKGLCRPLVDYRAHGANVVGVAPTGLPSLVRQRRRSLAATLRASVTSKRALAEDFLERVREQPLRPSEEGELAPALRLFLGGGAFSDHRELWAQTRGNTDLGRRLAQWYGGLLIDRTGRLAR